MGFPFFNSCPYIPDLRDGRKRFIVRQPSGCPVNYTETHYEIFSLSDYIGLNTFF
jgi:CCR4-NOT transcriptional regulation complex NOT5 subunit